jgi:hypothetical protein
MDVSPTEIACFNTFQEVQQRILTQAASTTEGVALQDVTVQSNCIAFVTLYNYAAYDTSGGSYTLCYDKAYLAAVSWDNKTSSFKNLNGRCSYHYKGKNYTYGKVGNCAPEGIRNMADWGFDNQASSVSQTIRD